MDGILASFPKELWLVVGSSAVTAAGFLVTRWIRGEGVSERLERASKTIDLRRKLRDENLSVEELAKLEQQYAGRRREKINTIELQTSVALLTEEFSPLDSQQAMNQVAAAELKIALAELDKVEIQLSWLVEDFERESFDQARKAWVKYSEAQSRFEAAGWEGGSGQALIYASAKRAIVVRRIAEIKSTIEERNPTRDPGSAA